ncbi:MAG TPA: hypothetical protein PLB96_01185 [Syntrophales bacterium]|nr:hypothetical protein [Syntrophales bacterium]
MLKTFRLSYPDVVDEAVRLWGEDVVAWDREKCTVTVDIDAEDLARYEHCHEVDNIDLA